MGLLVKFRGFSRDQLKALVKGSEVVKAGFEAYLFDVHLILKNQFTGIAYPDFKEEPGERFSGPGFKIPAKGIGYQICNSGNFIQINFSLEVV